MRVRCLVVFLPALLAFAAATEAGQQSDFTVRLESRTFTPPEEISRDFLKDVALTPLPRLHAFVQLWERPGRKVRDGLAVRGVVLLYHVHTNLWVASVSKGFIPDAYVADRARWLDRILPVDKVTPRLAKGEYEQWAVTADGQLMLSVEIYAHVPAKEAWSVLSPLVSQLRPWGIANGWYVVAPVGNLRALAACDQVKHIRTGPHPFWPLNNFTRRDTHVDEVQQADLSSGTPSYGGLTGYGIQIGFWDSGIDLDHEDFAIHDGDGVVIGSRVLVGTPDSRDHGTGVAGVMAASGYSSECMATPYLYRGMAPEAELLSYLDDGSGPQPFIMATALSDYGMDLSNHSNVQSVNGSYDEVARTTDEMVRGTLLFDGEALPARAMVFGVGNNGTLAEYGQTIGYFAVNAPAKNSLAIGATIANAGVPGHLAELSSLGPTWDGRIKPDLVAPGDRVVTTSVGSDCYSTFDGTSFSAPAVTGIVALVLEQYAELGVDLDTEPPLPSTLKAVLIQSATDLVHEVADWHDWPNPDTGSEVLFSAGPDYATGYGQVDALAAVSLVREDNAREATISERDQVDEYLFEVGPGAGTIQFTLAWDDEPYLDTAAEKTESRLVNDLELRLVDPAGGIHLPWVLAPLTPADLPGDPDPITAGDITPAFRGEDHLNNVEQVTVPAPMTGTWRVRVEVDDASPGLLDRAQPYSLAGDFHGPIHFCDWTEVPGSVYRMDGGEPEAIFTSPGWSIYRSAFAPDGTLYVNQGNGFVLYEIDPESNQSIEVYRHQTYLRDLGFDPAGHLYVSESSGAGGDGVIYRVHLGPHVTLEPFYRVLLAEVDGFWAGDFTFDRDGVLYLSSGNTSRAKIYRVDDPPAASPPSAVFQPGGSVCGIVFDRDNRLHYSNWSTGPGTIYRVDLATLERTLVHSIPGRRIWDVSFR